MVEWYTMLSWTDVVGQCWCAIAWICDCVETAMYWQQKFIHNSRTFQWNKTFPIEFYFDHRTICILHHFSDSVSAKSIWSWCTHAIVNHCAIVAEARQIIKWKKKMWTGTMKSVYFAPNKMDFIGFKHKSNSNSYDFLSHK